VTERKKAKGGPENVTDVTAKKKGQRDRKQAMLRALEATLGVVTPACKNAGVERITHYRWMKSDKRYREQVESITDIALDFAESRLHGKIKDGDTASILFYLKTKGKARGYVEKMEQDANFNITGSIPIESWIKEVIKS
jgi:hypothetical protein